MVSGFGDGAPGYLPTADCWREGYDDVYCWVDPSAAEPLIAATEVGPRPAGGKSEELPGES